MKQFFFIFFIFFSFIQSNTVSSANFHSDSNIIRVGFSPGSTAQKIILDAIKEASTSIDIAAYSFTSKLISLALMDAEHRGVKIRVLADKKSNSGKYTAVTYLSNHKIPILQKNMKRNLIDCGMKH
uniref:Mitochondrial cardiolipin hydrolase n=1 Tax=Glossina pallidipes TaxID=7398 RepID=A0A1A9Z1B8_GLOPL